MADPYVGEIRAFGFNFAPVRWLLCNGTLLPVRQYQALFTLIGATYGGDGTTTFAVPDFRGRTPVSQGTGPGLTPRVTGEAFGNESVTLLTTEMPSHTHPVTAYLQGTAAKRSAQPVAGYALGSSTKAPSFLGATPPPTPDTFMSPNAIGAAGGSLPHENRQPYLALNFCICFEGVFPSFP